MFYGGHKKMKTEAQLVKCNYKVDRSEKFISQ